MIDAFNSFSRYQDDQLNIEYIHIEQMVHRIYPEILLDGARVSDSEAAFIDLNLSIHNDAIFCRGLW